jgi:hypothetical protein
MNRRLAELLVPALLAFSGLLGAVTQSDREASQASPSAADQRNLQKVAAEVREAILSEDVNALLRHISRTESLVCTDTGYSYKEVKAFLHDKKSHLYMSLFDSAGFTRLCGAGYQQVYLASDRELLRGTGQAISIVGISDLWARVTLTSAGSKIPIEWYFHREGRAWKLAGGSLSLGSCQCG